VVALCWAAPPVALGVACATDASPRLQIKASAVLSAGDCSVPGTATTLFRDHGILDLALPDGSTPPTTFRACRQHLGFLGGSAAEEMNNITLHHFDIALSARVSPGTIRVLHHQHGGSSVTIAPVAQLARRWIHHSRPLSVSAVADSLSRPGGHGEDHGERPPRRDGNQKRALRFTVDVCAGCLQADYADPALAPYRYPANVPMCASFAGSPNPYMGDACLPHGQDKTIFCCGITENIGGKSNRSRYARACSSNRDLHHPIGGQRLALLTPPDLSD